MQAQRKDGCQDLSAWSSPTEDSRNHLGLETLLTEFRHISQHVFYKPSGLLLHLVETQDSRSYFQILSRWQLRNQRKLRAAAYKPCRRAPWPAGLIGRRCSSERFYSMWQGLICQGRALLPAWCHPWALRRGVSNGEVCEWETHHRLQKYGGGKDEKKYLINFLVVLCKCKELKGAESKMKHCSDQCH